MTCSLLLPFRRDTQDVFAEPVTEDIAPGYSQMIPFAMDLTTMAAKVESNKYPSVNEFKDDFVLMCNNAMTYNAPDTMYYGIAKNLLTSGLKIIAKVVVLLCVGGVFIPCLPASLPPSLPPSLSQVHLGPEGGADDER